MSNDSEEPEYDGDFSWFQPIGRDSGWDRVLTDDSHFSEVPSKWEIDEHTFDLWQALEDIPLKAKVSEGEFKRKQSEFREQATRVAFIDREKVRPEVVARKAREFEERKQADEENIRRDVTAEVIGRRVAFFSAKYPEDGITCANYVLTANDHAQIDNLSRIRWRMGWSGSGFYGELDTCMAEQDERSKLVVLGQELEAMEVESKIAPILTEFIEIALAQAPAADKLHEVAFLSTPSIQVQRRAPSRANSDEREVFRATSLDYVKYKHPSKLHDSITVLGLTREIEHAREIARRYMVRVPVARVKKRIRLKDWELLDPDVPGLPDEVWSASERRGRNHVATERMDWMRNHGEEASTVFAWFSRFGVTPRYRIRSHEWPVYSRLLHRKYGVLYTSGALCFKRPGEV